jgi:hypothetical protein
VRRFEYAASVEISRAIHAKAWYWIPRHFVASPLDPSRNLVDSLQTVQTRPDRGAGLVWSGLTHEATGPLVETLASCPAAN